MTKTAKAVRRKYNIVARLYDKVLPLYTRKTIGLAVEAVSLRGEEQLLDIGCGTGELEKALLQTKPKLNIFGVDLSEDMLNIARKKLPNFPNITFQEGDILNIELPANFYDAVFSLSNLHYFPYPNLIFKKVSHLLKPKGLFVIIDWNRDTFRGKIYNAYMRFADPAFVKAYSPEEAIQLLGKEGLAVEKIDTFKVGLRWHMMRIVARKS